MAKTTCDWTVERLPWWVNGTLEEAEAERVERHVAECSACREELAATRQAIALYALHLPVETLLDLIEDEAAASYRTAAGAALSRAAVDDHLGHCPACREELALLRESRAAVEADPEAPGATVTAFAPSRVPPAAPAVGGHHRLDLRSLALAASLLLFVVAAGGWLLTGRVADSRGERLAELERRLAEATATLDEEAPSGAEATEGEADEAAAALAAAAGREAALAGEIAELRAEIERLGVAASGKRLEHLAGVGPSLPWDLPTVMRGPEERPAEPIFELPAGEKISIVPTDVPGEPLRLVIEDAASGRRLDERGLTRYDTGFGPHTSIFLSAADFPAGVLRLRLFAGGDEIGSCLVRVGG